MSAQPQNSNKVKKRASVAARMAFNAVAVSQQPRQSCGLDATMSPSMAHIQEHPLACGGSNRQPNQPYNNNNSNRRGNARVYVNANAAGPSSGSLFQPYQQRGYYRPFVSPVRAASNYFGADIPEGVMEDLLFRFLYNIPENEKNVKVRVCFQVEQAHWFFVDFYCSAEHNPETLCKKLGFREFTRQVFHKCDYLLKWKNEVEAIIDEFRFYKSNVPTYGVILLDSSLNYVLLVQGYYASKNSWGFPKGKVNEDEIPIQCAIRETYEEVGFDATDHLAPNCRPLQYFLNDTLVRLYIAIDVPMDHPFGPHLRKEIRKIAWFSVWDLPKDRNDEQTCRKLGFTPNNFYSVLPFVNSMQAFVKKQQNKRAKPKVTILRKDSSAFNPVVPKRSSTSLSDETAAVGPSTSAADGGVTTQLMDDFLFKPLEFVETPTSYTGQAFLDKFFKQDMPSTSKDAGKTAIVSPSQPAETINPPSPSTTSQQPQQIRQPKPVHPNLIINVYEAPPSESNTPVPFVQQTTQTQSQHLPSSSANFMAAAVGLKLQPPPGPSGEQSTSGVVKPTLQKPAAQKAKRNCRDKQTQTDMETQRPTSAFDHPSETVKMLFEAARSQTNTPRLADNAQPPVFRVQLCKAWSEFKFDMSWLSWSF